MIIEGNLRIPAGTTWSFAEDVTITGDLIIEVGASVVPAGGRLFLHGGFVTDAPRAERPQWREPVQDPNAYALITDGPGETITGVSPPVYTSRGKY